MRSLDCHIAALLAMTRSNGRAWFRPSISDASPNVDIANHKVVWQSTHFCHCEPVRVWQSSLRRYVGCRDDAGGWPCAIAGLPRRDSVPPRNDNAKTGRVTKGVAGMGAVGCAVAGLPCRCAPRNDKKREWWTSISDASPNVDIANHKVVWQSTHFCHCEPVRVWQSSLRRYAGCRDDAGGWPCAIAGLPRRDSVPPRNDNAKTGRVTKGGREWARWDAVAGLPRRCAPRNDKKREWWTSISDASPNVDIARKVSKRTDVAIHTLLSLRARQGVAIQSETLCGMPGRCGGLALRYRWIATSGLRPSSQ
jgi:hypothetical protein